MNTYEARNTRFQHIIVSRWPDTRTIDVIVFTLIVWVRVISRHSVCCGACYASSHGWVWNIKEEGIKNKQIELRK